jgi:hypothetical protein
MLYLPRAVCRLIISFEEGGQKYAQYSAIFATVQVLVVRRGSRTKDLVLDERLRTVGRRVDILLRLKAEESQALGY